MELYLGEVQRSYLHGKAGASKTTSTKALEVIFDINTLTHASSLNVIQSLVQSQIVKNMTVSGKSYQNKHQA